MNPFPQSIKVVLIGDQTLGQWDEAGSPRAVDVAALRFAPAARHAPSRMLIPEDQCATQERLLRHRHRA